MRPILLLEINEVPWRLLDKFLGREDLPHLATFFSGAKTYTTISSDRGELSPWITWPSFHRGIPDTEHHVQFLGQDPVTFGGVPIWDEYRRLGHEIGVCGSLQSWPPRDPGAGGFYIPDTFSQDEQCIPAWVEPFQSFNLRQTRSNGLVIDRESLFTLDSLKSAARLAVSAPRLGIRPTTIAAVASQLLFERFDSRKLARRPCFQAVLIWDVFLRLFNPLHPPAFSTFFTNHIAGIMHRYWDHIFPEDFGPERASLPCPQLDTMIFGLKLLDSMIGDALSFQRKNPELILIFASSMGQNAVHRPGRKIELSIPSVEQLMRACGLEDAQFESLIAMVPQVCVRIPESTTRSKVHETLLAARSGSDRPLFRIDEQSDRLSITVLNPPDEEIQTSGPTLLGKKLSWIDAGIRANRVNPGTGYHIPEGVMAVFGQGIKPGDDRVPMPATDAKDFILNLAGVQ